MIAAYRGHDKDLDLAVLDTQTDLLHSQVLVLSCLDSYFNRVSSSLDLQASR